MKAEKEDVSVRFIIKKKVVFKKLKNDKGLYEKYIY